MLSLCVLYGLYAYNALTTQAAIYGLSEYSGQSYKRAIDSGYVIYHHRTFIRSVTGSDNSALDNSALDNKALENSALDNSALDNSALKNSA